MEQTTYETIAFDIGARIGTITLNRPEVHNAFNAVMLTELIALLQRVSRAKSEVHVVILTGAGSSFCAGADLTWMKRVRDYTYEENIDDSAQVSECMYLLYSLPQPTLARINGAAIGGAMGLVSACDIVIAQENAVFSLSEVKLGLVPACISPYVLKKAGEGACRELFLSGERFSARKAQQLGLVNEVTSQEQLNTAVQGRAEQLLKNGPEAMAVCKQLLEQVSQMPLAQAKIYTAEVISKLRMSEEGQEGMSAFLQKRVPRWRQAE